jgi:hypothetical protein
MKLEYSYLYLIRIKEIPGLINGVIGIVVKHNPENLGVKPFFDLLVEQQSQLKSFTEPRTSHPLTPLIKDNRKRLVELAQAIVIQTRAVEKGKISTKSQAAFLIAPSVKKYLVNIAKNNSKSIETVVTNFLLDLADSELLQTAATTIGIGDYVGELKLVKGSLDSNKATRNADNSARRIIKEKNLKSGIITALTNLLKAIDLAQVQNTTLDYTPVIAELNELFVSYMASIRGRSTRNTNAVIKKRTVASSTTTTATAD